MKNNRVKILPCCLEENPILSDFQFRYDAVQQETLIGRLSVFHNLTFDQIQHVMAQLVHMER